MCQSLFSIGLQASSQVFSSEYYEIFKNAYFKENLRTTASKEVYNHQYRKLKPSSCEIK